MSKKGRPSEMKMTDDVPPGATAKAHHRPTNPGGGPPGSGAGDRHMAGDTGPEIAAGEDGDPGNDFGYDDTRMDQIGDTGDEFIGSGPDGERREAYGGPSGGAVGGPPAEGRASGGHLRPGQGIKPGGVHRGDSTVGADPSADDNG